MGNFKAYSEYELKEIKNENRFNDEFIPVQNNAGDNKKEDEKKRSKTYREDRGWSDRQEKW
tara:strand:+ start:2289 stop:2471 length:183 start_codon:yes stop_codon:yes gene_type:complete